MSEQDQQSHNYTHKGLKEFHDIVIVILISIPTLLSWLPIYFWATALAVSLILIFVLPIIAPRNLSESPKLSLLKRTISRWQNASRWTKGYYKFLFAVCIAAIVAMILNKRNLDQYQKEKFEIYRLIFNEHNLVGEKDVEKIRLLFSDDAELHVDQVVYQGIFNKLNSGNPTIYMYYSDNPKKNDVEKFKYRKELEKSFVLGDSDAIAWTKSQYKESPEIDWKDNKWQVWYFKKIERDSGSTWRIDRFIGGLERNDAKLLYEQYLKGERLSK